MTLSGLPCNFCTPLDCCGVPTFSPSGVMLLISFLISFPVWGHMINMIFMTFISVHCIGSFPFVFVVFLCLYFMFQSSTCIFWSWLHCVFICLLAVIPLIYAWCAMCVASIFSFFCHVAMLAPFIFVISNPLFLISFLYFLRDPSHVVISIPSFLTAWTIQHSMHLNNFKVSATCD